MSDTTAIEWCDSTFNPWIGCTKVSPACDHCYAEISTPARVLRAAGAEPWGPHGVRKRTSTANWREPLHWQKHAHAFHQHHGRRRRVFCASLADWLDNAVPIEWLRDLCSLIELTPDLEWLLLTKRISNALPRLIEARSHDWLAGRRNVALGITVCNQDEADRDIPKLLATPARARFLSIEPMLGPIDLTQIPISGSGHHEFDPIVTANVLKRAESYPPLPMVDWVICGGESGPKARPMRSAWAQGLRDQCAAASVPFLFKQWGEHLGELQDGAHDHEPLELNASDDPVRVGKKAAGRLLDGLEHNGFPEFSR